MVAVGSLPGVIAWRNQVGLYDSGHGWIKYGLGVGSPDIVCSVRGRLVGIEVKSPTGKCSREQIQCHRIWREAGIPVAVVRSGEEGRQFVDHVLAFVDESVGQPARHPSIHAMALSAPFLE